MCFEQLVDGFGFEPRTAYTITMRVFRGGGLTKDALYLQGLVEVLDYLGDGGEVEPLLIGKIAVEHVPIVRELLFAGYFAPAPAATQVSRFTGGTAASRGISSAPRSWI